MNNIGVSTQVGLQTVQLGKELMLKEIILAAAKKHAEAEIDLHKANIEVYMRQVVGIGEHSDIVETIQKELDKMATAHDRLEMLNKYFKD